MRIIKLFRRILLIVSALIAMLYGAFFLGPFMTSDAYQWLKEFAVNYPFVMEFLDIEGMLIEKLISTTVPVFTVWSLVFFIYASNKHRLKNINDLSPYLSMFTGATGAYVLFLGFVILGLSLYGYHIEQFSSAVISILIVSFVLITTGLFMKKAAKPFLKPYQFVQDHPLPFAWLYAVLALVAFTYGIFASPLQIIDIIESAYETYGS
jgi:hypothetical protein